MKIQHHPTVVAHRAKSSLRAVDAPLDPASVRQLALGCGASDVGFVSLSRSELDGDRDDILAAFPRARTLISFVCSMNPDSIRSPARSIANLEFHHTGDHVNEVARGIIEGLRERGVRAVNPAMGFPMEMDRFPAKIWVVGHKTVAVAAGLGKMGIHRNVIHPKFGNFVLLGTVITDAAIAEEGAPIDYDPCLECKLCVAACPVGAIAPDGRFDFSACYTHNYREFMGGFTDWVETVADSSSAREYRSRVTDAESSSMWQSLSFGANYKAAYCMAVCPAGEDVIGPFVDDKKQFKLEVLKPLREKPEVVYVVKGSDAETHVAKRFPNKTARRVGSGLRPASVAGFLRSLSLVFQPGVAKKLGIDAAYHFTFTGDERIDATIEIRNGALLVRPGHEGEADVAVTADSRTWLDVLAKNRGMLGAVLRRRIRVAGPLSLMKKFGSCFPS
jgi:NAD-dependent dihydropyrimidine dehydrogenase PreA subunit